MDGEKHSQLHNLENKTLPQLMELLERQEHLISRKSVLNNLPDKGQKVKDFAQTLRRVIAERQRQATIEGHNAVLSTSAAGPSSDQQTKNQAMTPQEGHARVAATEEVDLKLEEQILDSPILGGGEITHIDSDTTASLSECLGQLTVSELASPRMSSGEKVVVAHADEGNLETRYTNSYANVMKRHEGEIKQKPFKPHSSLKICSIQELPEAYKLKSKSSKESEKVMVQSSSQEAKEHKTEERPMPDPVYKFGGAKEISVEDSVQLQKKQRDELEKSKSIQAAERLAERLNIKTVHYQPETVDMNYRNSDMASDADIYDSDDVSDDESETLNLVE